MIEERTKMSDFAIYLKGLFLKPKSNMSFSNFFFLIIRSNLSLNGPTPIIINLEYGIFLLTFENASIRYSCPFTISSLPTVINLVMVSLSKTYLRSNISSSIFLPM